MKKLLLFLIFFMSGTSYLLAQSAVTGTVTDENGNEFIKTVVKGDFKKNIIFYILQFLHIFLHLLRELFLQIR